METVVNLHHWTTTGHLWSLVLVGMEATSTGFPFFDMTKARQNSQAQLGAYISRLFTPYYTDDTALLKSMTWVNETIDRFRRKPATYENCRLLKDYINVQMCKMLERPLSPARSELVRQCQGRIDTLEQMERQAELFNYVQELGMEQPTETVVAI